MIFTAKYDNLKINIEYQNKTYRIDFNQAQKGKNTKLIAIVQSDPKLEKYGEMLIHKSLTWLSTKSKII